MKEQLIAPPPEMIVQKLAQLDRVLTLIKESEDFWWENGRVKEILFHDSHNVVRSFYMTQEVIKTLSETAFAMYTDLKDKGWQDLGDEILAKYTGAGERR